MKIKNQTYTAKAPEALDFASREELVEAWVTSEGRSQLYARAAACALGYPIRLKTRLGAFPAGQILQFGRAAYGELRELGATREEILEAGIAVLQALGAHLYPREAEVAEKANFTAATPGEETGTPST